MRIVGTRSVDMTKMGYELYTILASGVLLLARRLPNLFCLVRSMKLS
jgi:hypothetical protein